MKRYFVTIGFIVDIPKGKHDKFILDEDDLKHYLETYTSVNALAQYDDGDGYKLIIDKWLNYQDFAMSVMEIEND